MFSFLRKKPTEAATSSGLAQVSGLPQANTAAPNAEQWLQRLEWTVLKRLDGQLQGDYRSLFRGTGLVLAGIYAADIKRRVVVSQGSDLNKGLTATPFVPTSGFNPTDLLYDDDFKSKVYAAFGQVAYNVTDQLELALALRYDSEVGVGTRVTIELPASRRDL